MVSFADWKKEFLSNKFRILISLLFLVIAGFIYFVSGTYAQSVGYASVSDIILDHIPVVNLSWIYTWGFILVIAVMFFYPLFFNVKEFHIALSQFSQLVLIRSFFVALTHLKAPVGAFIVEPVSFISFLSFQNDLFFSGHTAVPFLGYLIFRKEKIRYFFLAATFVMAATVLLMHLHYSIDVFAALFIAYGSYRICELIFKRINLH